MLRAFSFAHASASLASRARTSLVVAIASTLPCSHHPSYSTGHHYSTRTGKGATANPCAKQARFRAHRPIVKRRYRMSRSRQSSISKRVRRDERCAQRRGAAHRVRVTPRRAQLPTSRGPGCRLHVLRVRNMRARERASERVHHHTALHPTLSVTSRQRVGVLLGLRKHLTDTLAE